LDVFGRYAPVKDIRIVRNKHTNEQRDFAFIEFFSIKEAEDVLVKTVSSDFTILGEPVQVFFSKNRINANETSFNYSSYQNAIYEQQIQYLNYMNM
jgi:RNA-binding protein 5/10